MPVTRFFLSWLRRIEAATAVGAFSLCALVLFADVVGREIFGHGVFWAQRLAVYCATFAGLLGFVLVVDGGGHLRASTFDRLVPEPWNRAMFRLADLISAGICLFIAAYGAKFVHESFIRQERGVALDIAIWPIQMIVPFAFLSAGVRYIAFVIHPDLRPAEGDKF